MNTRHISSVPAVSTRLPDEDDFDATLPGVAPWSVVNQDKQMAVSSPLRNNFDDVGRNDSVRRLLALRKSAAAGKKVRRQDLTNFTSKVGGTSTELFLDRNYFTKAILPTLRGAKDSIHIAVSELRGEFGDYVTELLIQKKKDNPNLKVRIVVDTMASNLLLPWSEGHTRFNRLKDNGIEIVEHGFISKGMQMEHRKLYVIDGQTGFFGGAPLADNYYASDAFWERFAQMKLELGVDKAREVAFGPSDALRREYGLPNDMPNSHDFGIRYKGDGVAHLQTSFLQSWLYHKQSIDPKLSDKQVVARYFPTPSVVPAQSVAAKFTHVVPLGESEMKQNLLDIIGSATKTLDLELAYVFEESVINALEAAAKRGVKVRLLTDGYEATDWKPLYWVYRKHYETLLKAGVQIFELKSYSHIKLITADSRIVFASTGNAEWGSFSGFFDDNVLIDSPALAKDVLKRVIERDMQDDRAHQVTLENLPKLTAWQKFLTWLVSWLAPLLLKKPTQDVLPRHAVEFKPKTAPINDIVPIRSRPTAVAGLAAPRSAVQLRQMAPMLAGA